MTLRFPWQLSCFAALIALVTQPVILSGAVRAGDIRALVIGINEYGSYGKNLQGAVHDANDLARALEAIGVSSLRQLIDREASRDRILAAWSELLAVSHAGDTLILTYAGHGSQLPEKVKGSEKDGLDEVLLLSGYTAKAPGNRERIIDDELYGWFQQANAKGVKVVFVADGCHSGTLTRSVDPRAGRRRMRSQPSWIEGTDALSLAGLTVAPAEEVPEGLSFFAAGQEAEQVPEVDLRGDDGQVSPRGVLSYAFARALHGEADSNGDGLLSRSELQRYLQRTVRVYAEARQTPQFQPVLGPGVEDTSVLPTIPGVMRTRAQAQAQSPVPAVSPPQSADSPTTTAPLLTPASGTGAEMVVRLAVRGSLSSASPLSGGQALQTLTGVAMAASPETADIIWDPATRDVISALGDVVARNVHDTQLQGVIDKYTVLATLRQMVREDGLILRAIPDDQVHPDGSRLGFRAENMMHPYLTLFSLAGDGTLNLHYPEPHDAPDIALDKPFHLTFRAQAPFGADHIVAVLSARPLVALHHRLRAFDRKPAAQAVLAALQQEVAGVAHQTGLLGLFTAPKS